MRPAKKLQKTRPITLGLVLGTHGWDKRKTISRSRNSDAPGIGFLDRLAILRFFWTDPWSGAVLWTPPKYSQKKVCNFISTQVLLYILTKKTCVI